MEQKDRSTYDFLNTRSSLMSCISVVGARPQFVKAAVVSRALARAGVSESIVHSGQHYDDAMSGQFIRDLDMRIDVNLSVGSGSHAVQTARIMEGLDAYLDGLVEVPDWMVVFGDTNSTVAAALVAAKRQIPVAHVEAGLRSFNRSMPEELNRVVTDHLSSALFCSSEEGAKNLANEGVSTGVHIVGDVMFDAFEHYSKPIRERSERPAWIPSRPCVLMTLHRPANTNDPMLIPRLRPSLAQLDADVLWPVHPRFRAVVEGADLPANVRVMDPLGYMDILTALQFCDHVITDSGGLQKEAYWAKTPCTTLRTETEWTETLHGGWNVLASVDADLVSLVARTVQSEWRPLYGNADAGDRIAALLKG